MEGIKMAIAIILGIVLFILAIATGIISYFAFDDGKTAGGIASVVACVVLTLTFLCVPFSIKTVEAGEIAVVKELGKIIDTREAGTHFDFWMTRSYEKYDTKVRQLDITTQSYSNDKQTMDVAMTVQYQIKPGSAKEIALTYGGLTALEGKIQSIAIERTKAVLSSYTADKIIMERATVSAAVTTEIENTVGDNYHVDITMVALTNIDFSDVYEQAVEAKMVAEQAKLQKDYENQAAEAAARTAAEVAKMEADAAAYAKEKAAEAEAKAIIAKAQAEAEALNIQTLEVAKMLGLTVMVDGVEVLDPNMTSADAKLIAEYIEYIKYLESWDGKLPETVVGDDTGIIINPNK
jgi:regulator of protease activity HflC (stomatin/prohibitin superfamily)